jgi:Tfp pilus assembly protein PilZ
MKPMTCHQEQLLVPVESEINRRQAPRMNGEFALTFSGMDDGQMVMGDGQVFDLSQGGMAVLANRLVKPGMELALFIELPDSEEHLCVPEARVSWVRGRRFGIALRTLRLEDRNRLRYFLWVHQGPMSV